MIRFESAGGLIVVNCNSRAKRNSYYMKQ